MREWWANVYPDTGEAVIGEGTLNLSHCASLRNPGLRAYRIHVRLKPEGAPLRYGDDLNRAAWERNPEGARACVAAGCAADYVGSR